MTTQIVPDIEENIPLPKSATEAMPDLPLKESLDMHTRTIKLVADLNGTPIAPTEEDKDEARELAKRLLANPRENIDLAQYKNEVLAYMAGMIAEYDQMVVKDLAELKLFVVNQLVETVIHAKDQKAKIAALSKLGEVDGVDAFKKRSEVTVKIQPLEEVERELFEIIGSLKSNTIDVDFKEV
jgi:hypothetical protein